MHAAVAAAAAVGWKPSGQASINQSIDQPTPMYFSTSKREEQLGGEESLAGMLARIVVRWYELGLRSARGCELRSLGSQMTACPCTSALSRTKPHPLGIWFVKGDRHAESSTAIEESRLRCQKSHGLRSAGWCGHPCHHTLPCLLEPRSDKGRHWHARLPIIEGWKARLVGLCSSVTDVNRFVLL
jgi:hypothetical protein